MFGFSQNLYSSFEVLAVRIWPAKDYTRIAIEHKKKNLKLQTFTLKNPDRLVLDLMGNSLLDSFENIISNHPAIHQVAVIGIPHDTWGEAVHAIVTLEGNEQPTEAELIKFCKEQIASYKCPVSVSFRDEPMPLSPINKILKTELRRPFWADRKSNLV